MKTVTVQCPSCGKKHPVSPAQLMVRLSLQGLDEDALKARTAKATKASAIARRKRLIHRQKIAQRTIAKV